MLENAFPPIPSDVIAVFGAFLSHRGVTTPRGVFLIAWGGSVSGAVLVYSVSRRYGRRFFASSLGRRLLTADALATMEREYLRFGVAGIFLSRLLPGFRSFVAPFAGLVGLSPARFLLPAALASGLWFAALTVLGARLGEQWSVIERLLGHLNRAFAVAAVLVAMVVLWRLAARRPRPGRSRLWRAIHVALGGDAAATATAESDPAVAGAATLLLELLHHDRMIPLPELREIEAVLNERWHLPARHPPGTVLAAPADTAEFPAAVTGRYDHGRRVALMERLWHLAANGGLLGAHEDSVMRRAALLLGVSEVEAAEARRRVEA